MSYYGQQQPASSSSGSSNLFGDMQSSEGRKLYTELTGVDMNTFSNNTTFSVPRFLQDNFDPAILHSADNTNTAAYPSQSASSSSNQQHPFRDLDMDYNQTNAVYDNSYGNTAVDTSGPYSNLRFPTAPMFPPIPMPAASYPNATIAPVDMMDSSVSSNTAAAQQKPPRSSALSLNGLPIYSASGFDMLDILARVATRPQPKISIGPVDMSCAFLVVDITREDSPIIYASQTFSELTGYSELETLGRNCRFLQAPPGFPLEKGGAREHTDLDSVTQMAQNVSANRECQVTLVNYRKTGEAFINCVSIIPVIPSGGEPVRYHVGFQVDLAVQPLAIMRSVQSGTYVTNYSSTPLPPVVVQQSKLSVRGLSKDMAGIIRKIGGTGSSGSATNESADRHRLSLALLEESPDAVFVVSLKGTFLYVSPSITRLLDYDADYFLNKNLADICHPSDLAPTMRNIKESTTTAPPGTSNPTPLNPASTAPNDIVLLFRARRSNGTYVWLDCPGKLHADTSRGRKALLLRLRKVDIPRITWGTINSAGGVYKDDVYLRVAKDDRGLIVACSKSVEEALGRKREEVVGKTLIEMIVDDLEGTKVDAIRAALGAGGLGGADTICASPNTETSPTKVVYCNLPALVSGKRSKKIKARTAGGPPDAGATANGKVVVLASAELTFFPALDTPDGDENSASAWRSKLRTVVVRVRIVQRHPMRNDLRDGTVVSSLAYPPTSAKSVYGAPPTSASSAFPSTSGRGIPGYGLGTNEMPLASLTEQINTPLQLFQHIDSSESTGLGMRKEGYQVPLTGNVNAIDDSVTDDVDPPSNDGYGPFSAVGNGGAIGSGSSWLYDLEQLRKRNQELRAELAEAKKEQRSKLRARGGASFNAGHSLSAYHLQSSGTQSHNITMARLDALASASTSGLSAMNARRAAAAAPSTASSAWAVPFPGGGGGAGDGGGDGNPPGLNLTMPPPALPHQLGGGDDSYKRTWSQTDMHAHSEWHH